ncbi:hypothetical protein [Streptomyces sp. NPDC048392]|uniref:hypothetical protein n=1 Tax=Streptomyces sp. NPDC048392 TaxID=3365543 RepID=UPI003719D6AE
MPAVTELLGLSGSLDEIEDHLCLRLGTLLSAQHPGPEARREEDVDPLQAYSPDQLLDALTTELVSRAQAASEAADGPSCNSADGEETSAAENLWQLLAALARVSPHPVSQDLVRAADRLASRLGLDSSGALAREPRGTALWCRDAYGSRFAITAPFPASGDVPDRWYLWDIDVCATDAFTVDSGYHDSPEAALTAWRETAGREATQDAVLIPVNNPRFAARLLPDLPDFLHPGGESEEQFAEFHRCRRLAQELTSSPTLDGRAAEGPKPGKHHVAKEKWISEFRAWRATHSPGQPTVPDDYAPAEGEQPPTEQDVLAELADSWSVTDFPEVSYACSPHRISSVTTQILDFYDDNFASVLVRLLPDLTGWLTERTGVPAALADRSRARAEACTQRKHPNRTEDETGMLTPVPE